MMDTHPALQQVSPGQIWRIAAPADTSPGTTRILKERPYLIISPPLVAENHHCYIGLAITSKDRQDSDAIELDTNGRYTGSQYDKQYCLLWQVRMIDMHELISYVTSISPINTVKVINEFFNLFKDDTYKALL